MEQNRAILLDKYSGTWWCLSKLLFGRCPNLVIDSFAFHCHRSLGTFTVFSSTPAEYSWPTNFYLVGQSIQPYRVKLVICLHESFMMVWRLLDFWSSSPTNSEALCPLENWNMRNARAMYAGSECTQSNTIRRLLSTHWWYIQSIH